jgi:hypothetical protein
MEVKHLCRIFDLIAVVFQAIYDSDLTVRQNILLTGNSHGNPSVHDTVDFQIPMKMQIVSGAYILLSQKTRGIVPLNLILSFLILTHNNTFRFFSCTKRPRQCLKLHIDKAPVENLAKRACVIIAVSQLICLHYTNSFSKNQLLKSS